MSNSPTLLASLSAECPHGDHACISSSSVLLLLRGEGSSCSIDPPPLIDPPNTRCLATSGLAGSMLQSLALTFRTTQPGLFFQPTTLTKQIFADAEASKRFFLDDDVADAKRWYGVARRTFDAFAAQLRATADEEKATKAAKRAACFVCASAQTRYEGTMSRTSRTLETYKLFDAGVDGRGAARAAGGAFEGRRLQKRSRATGTGGELPSAPGTKRKGPATGRARGAGEVRVQVMRPARVGWEARTGCPSGIHVLYFYMGGGSLFFQPAYFGG